MEEPRLEYELIVRQQPKAARMCGLGGKADRRPIDPPPIIQLRVLEYPPSSSSRSSPVVSNDFLQNPYYFMFASLASPDSDDELHVLKDGKTRCTTGSIVSSLYHLKDTENNNQDAGFFVFPDLSVRTEGSYRLKLSLFEVKGHKVHHCKSIFSNPFYVYTAKKFPGMEESTQLSCSLADQGIKIRIRKEIRQRKKAGAANPIGQDDGAEDSSPRLSPTVSSTKRLRQASDAGKGKGKATTRVAKRPKLVESSPSLEQIELQDDSQAVNSVPTASGSSHATSISNGADAWTAGGSAGESANGFPSASAPQAWAPPPPSSAQSIPPSSLADADYRAIPQHAASSSAQLTSPYHPPIQNHPHHASQSPNWPHPSTHSAHIQHNVQAYASSSGYSSTAPGSTAGSSPSLQHQPQPASQHQQQLVTSPPPPPDPVALPPNAAPMPIAAPMPRQPGRHVYDMAPPQHEAPYQSPHEIHAHSPAHAAPPGPGVPYAPSYARYYSPHPTSQSPSIYSYQPVNNISSEYGSRDLRDRDERPGEVDVRESHMPSNGPGPPPPPPSQQSGYTSYGVPQHHPHYPSPVPPQASSVYTPHHTPYMSSAGANDREQSIQYNSIPPQPQYHSAQSQHSQQQQQQPAIRQAPPSTTPHSISHVGTPAYPPQQVEHLAHQLHPHYSPPYRRQDSGGVIFATHPDGGSNAFGHNGPAGGHERGEQLRQLQRAPSPHLPETGAGAGPQVQGDGGQQQQQQNLTLPPLRGGVPVSAQFSSHQHLHHHQHQHQQQQQQVPQPPQQQRTPVMAHHSHPPAQQQQERGPAPGYYASSALAAHPHQQQPHIHRNMSGVEYVSQSSAGAYLPPSQDGGMYSHSDMYNPQRQMQPMGQQWKRPPTMMMENRTPPMDSVNVGIHRANSVAGGMPMLRSHSSASASVVLDEGVNGLPLSNGVDHGGLGMKKNPLSIGSIVSDRPSS